jgi:Mg-chelatase subunit ChlI
MCVRMFAACILVSSASSADAERSISFLNLIIGALRTRLTWAAIRTHLIGREDIDPKTFPLSKVVDKWGETPRRRCMQGEKRKERKDKGVLRKTRKVMDYNHCHDRLKTILEEGEEEEEEEEDEEEDSSSSSSSSGSSGSDTSDADSSSSSSESSSGSNDGNPCK